MIYVGAYSSTEGGKFLCAHRKSEFTRDITTSLETIQDQYASGMWKLAVDIVEEVDVIR